MKTLEDNYPLSVLVSFDKLFEEYQKHLNSDNILLKERAKQILDIAKAYPILSEGIREEDDLVKMAPQIDLILEDLFSTISSENDIKAAAFPFHNKFFKTSTRYDAIINEAGNDYKLELMDFNNDEFYIMGCGIILQAYYGYKVDFKRPFYYKIPDANGILRSYRVLYNADYIEIKKTDRAKDITKEDVDILLENFENIDIWKEMFQPNTWVFRGFVIANMFDVTIDSAISDFKSHLLNSKINEGDINNNFENIFKTFFNINSLKIGFTSYNNEDKILEKYLYPSILLYDKQTQEQINNVLCNYSYDVLFNTKEIFNVTNVEKYLKKDPENVLLKNLNDQNIKSAILASLIYNNEVLGILEIASPNVNELNTINATKLKEVMPFMVDNIVRYKEQLINEFELVIQRECTSIHNSVHWKFLREAKNYFKKSINDKEVVYNEIYFENVYPLYGQIDIKGSSEARNNATKKDLTLQLNSVLKLLKEVNNIEALLIYEQYEHRITSFLNELKEHLLVDSEQQVIKFLEESIFPLFTYLRTKNTKYKVLLDTYCSLDFTKSGFAYQHRKDYDDSVSIINRNMSLLLDHKQIEAQEVFPHYFERFKTDGVEHNLYIGDSITQNPDDFDMIYLYNLRLWQLQVMCEMENNFYSTKNKLPLPLDVSSMILVFSNAISLRFRMDEKRFDVDGTYNARYEVIKKRVDKSYIKGTNERVTQPGKIAVIYSHSEDETEYLRYISFLQYKKQLDDDLEIVDVEDLQGVTGLKAIRVSFLYTNEKNLEKEYYTYEDLIKELN